MQFLPLIPGLIAGWVAWMKSPATAVLDVYLPVLLLLPEYYRWMLPSLPDPRFSQATVLPIAAVYFIKGARWRISFADLLILGFAFCVAYSEYRNAGYNEAQNLMFDMVAWVVLPYAITKGLIEPNGLRLQFARRIVFLLFAVALASLYEFRFGATPFRVILDRCFPGQGAGWVTTFRWGFARVAGPYGHAILAGVIFMIGFRLQRWLAWSDGWEPRFRFFSFFGWPKTRVLTFGLMIGLLITMVRGPWIGAILATGVAVIGRSHDRKRALMALAAAVILVGIPAGVVLYRYASVGRAAAKTQAQETAAYRKELIDKYVAIALERPVWGWGRNTWPKIAGMPSIDNYYLLLALMHGLVAVGFLAAIFVAMIARLLWKEMHGPPTGSRTSSLGFTLAGIYAGIGFSIATVFMGNQLIPLFAVLTGWSEGYLLSHRRSAAIGTRYAPPVAAGGYVFRRVVA